MNRPKLPAAGLPKLPQEEESIVIRPGMHQLLYVRFTTPQEGSDDTAMTEHTYVFLGPVVPEEMAMNISTIAFGPTVPTSALPDILGHMEQKH